MTHPAAVRQMIANAPDAPGVYIMKDAAGTVLYVGKAKSLRRRLTSYLTPRQVKTAALMGRVARVDYKLCATESIALLVEAGLIRAFKPKYNISLRDDKSYPQVKITDEPFPCVQITRKRADDGARYFGPYTSARLLRDALKAIRRYFPYRVCARIPDEPCLYSRIGLCPGPCAGKITRRVYGRTIKNIALLLEGKTDILVRKLGAQMRKAAAERRFEDAAKARDQIRALGVFEHGHGQPGETDELEGLKALLGLAKCPVRIEAFDISNIRGQQATASMVSFFMGRPDKDNYRRFRIKTVEGIDDYAMMAEAVRRRYARLIAEHAPLPDLVLIDGGRAHLMTAARELASLGVHLPVASIAKEQEHIYVTGKEDPIRLRSDTPALNLIRRVRDEAHRFAVAYHHLLRRKTLLGSFRGTRKLST